MRKILRNALVYFASAFMALTVAASAQAGKIRIALAETPSDELAAFFVALDRAKANGLEYEWTAFSDEELAIQAILSGQMDIGFGTPYSVMQKSKAPIRIGFIRPVKGVIIGQLLISIVGFGALFELYSANFLMKHFWAVLLVLFALAFLIAEFLAYLERRVAYYAACRSV